MRQRKMDVQTQQAVKEQAAQWLQGAKQAAAEPAPQATGKVVNLSRPEATQAQAAAVKTVAPVVAPAQEAVQEVPAAKKSVPEPERAQTPVVAAAQTSSSEPAPVQASVQVSVPAAPPAAAAPLPLPAAQPMVAQSAERMPSGGQWMVSGSSFDSARPRYPGQFAPSVSQGYAYAMPAPVQVAPAAPVAVAAVVPVQAASASPTAAVPLIEKLNQPLVQKEYAPVAPVSVAKVAPSAVMQEAPAKVQEPKPAAPVRAMEVTQDAPAKPVQRAEPVQQPVAPRQPTGPARSLQDGAVVMAVASPALVRQVDASGSKQAVQAMLPRRASAGGLFFETPDEPASSKPAAATKSSSPERVWP